ncbi:hypothetical protein AG1IA_06470 [Rhizoctonia solani AG-1 IA]|uniref:Uncharacterized protein n=1 Tax=Thanatephorus cucumeris (strain AG1-IA) TaxID=983506 RepID=L8WND8_THACA|nr:hypothetical protein AG1IA_06470 [Rhizoctonia solani AG-1 IA]
MKVHHSSLFPSIYKSTKARDHLKGMSKSDEFDPSTSIGLANFDMAQKSTVPFMMSLRESLSHTKDKWKRRLHLDSRDNALPISSPTTHPDRAQQHCPTETVSFRSAQSHSDTPFDSSLETLVDTIPRKAPSIWTSVRTLLATLEVSADAISPLKLAISGLRGCIDVYEGICTQQREHHELGTKLVTILKDLAEHIEQPIGPVMTNSVRRIYR